MNGESVALQQHSVVASFEASEFQRSRRISADTTNAFHITVIRERTQQKEIIAIMNTAINCEL